MRRVLATVGRAADGGAVLGRECAETRRALGERGRLRLRRRGRGDFRRALARPPVAQGILALREPLTPVHSDDVSLGEKARGESAVPLARQRRALLVGAHSDGDAARRRAPRPSGIDGLGCTRWRRALAE